MMNTTQLVNNELVQTLFQLRSDGMPPREWNRLIHALHNHQRAGVYYIDTPDGKSTPRLISDELDFVDLVEAYMGPSARAYLEDFIDLLLKPTGPNDTM